MAVTRADVARLAGVSPAVVSYVVNDGPRPVSVGARARVRAAIEELGYRPNAIAKALRVGMTRTIGLLTPSPVNPFFAELAEALERALFASGNILTIGITDDDRSRELRYLRSFLDRQVDGLMLISSHSLAGLDGDRLSRTPTLVLDRVPHPSGSSSAVCSLHVDNAADAACAVEHLQGHGHQVIGCIAGPPPLLVSEDRVAGWRGQQAAAGLDGGDDLLAHADFSEGGGAAAALALLGTDERTAARRGRRPSAVFVSSDAQAIGAVRACHQLGLRVPEDVALVSFDGTRAARYAHPPLTTMRQPVDEIASTAVQRVLARVADPALPPERTTLRSHLVVGETCGCRGGR